MIKDELDITPYRIRKGFYRDYIDINIYDIYNNSEWFSYSKVHTKFIHTVLNIRNAAYKGA
jgi:hypothetical protein